MDNYDNDSIYNSATEGSEVVGESNVRHKSKISLQVEAIIYIPFYQECGYEHVISAGIQLSVIMTRILGTIRKGSYNWNNCHTSWWCVTRKNAKKCDIYFVIVTVVTSVMQFSDIVLSNTIMSVVSTF